MSLFALFLIMAGDFAQFLAGVKQSPPSCPVRFPFDFQVERPAIWSEHYGPRLVSERIVQVSPGVAVVTGEVIEIGPPFGLVRRSIRILATQNNGEWSIKTSECGSEPQPVVIPRPPR